jgi:ABC-type multidrug transport system fused ATPase/permease subunit
MFVALWHLLKPDVHGHGRILLAAYLVSFLSLGASYCLPWFLSELLDKALPRRDLWLFFQYGGAMFVSLAVFLGCSLLRTYFLSYASELIFRSLRIRLAAAALKKPMSFFKRYETGDLITRISNDTEHLSLLVFEYVYAGLNSVTMIVIFVALMLAWEWHLGFYTVLALPCYAFLLSLMQRPLYRAALAARGKFSEQNETLLDIISGVREIRFYQQFQSASERFAVAAGGYTHANIRSVRIGEWAYNLMEFFTRFIVLMPFLLGGYWICSGRSSLTVGTLIAYNLYLTYIAYGLEVINVGVTKLAQAAPLIARLQELLDYPGETFFQSASINEIGDTTRIEFQSVAFSHGPTMKLFKDFSLTIEPGEKVAVMGPSGSGKSTLIDLLTRQILPQEGQILFGGRPLETYSLGFYLLNFGYVRQKPYLFKTSVRDNIATGWFDTPLDVIMEAARRVGLHEAIMSLPNEYDTIIGSGGVDLSGGQLQRLALARALVRDPAVLLLDEFTSALDSQTEEGIIQDLFKNFDRQTIVCVTHSQSVARHFSRIVWIEKS